MDLLLSLIAEMPDLIFWYFLFKADLPPQLPVTSTRRDDRLGEIPDPAAVCARAFQNAQDERSNGQALFLRGLVNRTKGRYAEAVSDFREVLRTDARHARAWFMLSEVLVQVGEYEQARQARQQALELDASLA